MLPTRTTGVILNMLFCFIRNEHRFLLAGLKLPRLADWTARQAAYLDAAKSFVLKLKKLANR